MNASARAVAVRGALLVLGALRVAALLTPSMVLWGLNATRFASPVLAWTLALVPLAALVPAAGAAFDRGLERLADRMPRPGLLAGALLFIAAAALVLLLPDRVWFVGDYLLREGAMREPGNFLRMFPQAQPLDVLLHHALPQAGLRAGIDTTLSARLLGGVEAGLLALLARRFARAGGLTGAAAVAVGSAVFAGGSLALFAGYSKPTVEVALLAVAVGVFGADLARGGRGALGVGVAFALAMALHRSAVSLLPGVIGWMVIGARRGDPRPRRTEWVLATIVVAATLAWFLPRLWRLFGTFDLETNFTSFEVREQGGMVAAAFSGLRLLDLANLVLLHAPLALLLPALAPPDPGPDDGGTRAADRRVVLGFAIQAAGHLPAVLFTYVTQGAFRDWDAHAGAFASLGLVAAALLAMRLRPSAGLARAGLASAVACAAFAGALGLLVAQHDLDGSLRRANAFLDQPPARTLSQRLATLDFLGLRALRLERFDDATDAFARLAAQAPHPRALALEGTAAILAGRDAQALRAFSTLLARDSSQSLGWFGVWLAARRTGADSLAARAEARVLAYPDTSAEMGRILAHLQHYPGLWARMPRGRFIEGSR